MDPKDWFLTADERGNPASDIDRPHAGQQAWSEHNSVQPLIHGGTYFRELKSCVDGMREGDLLMFTDWRGDPDERLTDETGSEVGKVFCAAARRGVDVRGLIWRSHLDRFQFSAAENRHLGTEIEEAGGEALLDMRVRVGGSHHQKFVVLRHPGRPELDVAFLGGIDLCHGRRDDAKHTGDPQAQPFAKVYGPRPPWHDIQLAIKGPAVYDVETVFRERWEDPQPLSRNPLHRVPDLIAKVDRRANPLPARLPAPQSEGDQSVQLLRTYPYRRPQYPFAPRGERSVARGYMRALGRAHALIYLEDQYLWSQEVASTFARALRDNPHLLLIAVLPLHPDQDGRISLPPNLVGRDRALSEIQQAAGDRFAAYGIENDQGTPIYVHAKLCVVDDVWASVGSNNFNRRSWTHDSELSAAVLDDALDLREPTDPSGLGDGARRYARELRLALASEHLERVDGDDADLVDPSGAFAAFAAAAKALEVWHANGRTGDRPPGRVRPISDPPLSEATKRWATPLYHRVYDPDGRPLDLKRRRAF